MKLIDLTGNKYGELTVIKRQGTHVRPSGAKFVTWLCKCSCGNEVVVFGYSLKSGATKSCGCKHFLHPLNNVKEEDDALYISVKDKTVIIDKEDYAKILPHRIYIGNHGYPAIGNKPLHQILLNYPKGMVVDHINHNKLDNRKQNLRIVTQSENMLNTKIHSNTGEFGISKCKGGYYKIHVNSKYIGCTKDFEKAIAMRNKALEGTLQKKYNYFL